MSHEDEYLSVEELIEIQKEETRDIIAALLEDGSDPDSLYEIEHHLFAEDFDTLEKAVIEAFKIGFEVLEAEVVEDVSELQLDSKEEELLKQEVKCSLHIRVPRCRGCQLALEVPFLKSQSLVAWSAPVTLLSLLPF